MKVRRPLNVVRPIADQMVEHFTAQGLVCEVGGSLRRQCKTVGDLDIVVRCSDLGQIALPDWVVFHRRGDQVAQGGMLMADGSELNVDVWAATEAQWGAFLWYITGSKVLNIVMRRKAQERGLKLSQFGLFRDGVQVDDGTERGVASALGMDWIDPVDRSWGVVEDVVRSFTVRSSSGEKFYSVKETERGWVCDCPHHTFRRVECKHIRSVAYNQMQ